MARRVNPQLGDLETFLRRETARRPVILVDLVTYNLVTRSLGNIPIRQVTTDPQQAPDAWAELGRELLEAAELDGRYLAGGSGYMVMLYQDEGGTPIARHVLAVEGMPGGDDMPQLVGTEKGQIIQAQQLAGRFADVIVRMAPQVMESQAKHIMTLETRNAMLEAKVDAQREAYEKAQDGKAVRVAFRKSEDAKDKAWGEVVEVAKTFAPAVVAQLPGGEEFLTKIGAQDAIGKMLEEVETQPGKFEELMQMITLLPVSDGAKADLAKSLNDRYQAILLRKEEEAKKQKPDTATKAERAATVTWH